MSPTAIIGQVLLWSGFLAGSLATVINLENGEQPWSTIDWSWYLVSVLVCVFGIIAIRIAKRSKHLNSDEHETSFASLPEATERLIAAVTELKKQQHSMKPTEIVAFIDARMGDDLRDFVDSRDAIVSQRGLQEFADVMTQFAAGERAINRCWSAAADGYVDEVELCLNRAEEFFVNTLNLLRSGSAVATDR